MRLRITDYSAEPDLADAIRRYHTLVRMTFASNVYKIVETPTSQIMRFAVSDTSAPPAAHPQSAQVEVSCPSCGTKLTVQANLAPGQPLAPGALPWPVDDKLTCGTCGHEVDMSPARKQIESASGERVVDP